MVISGLTRGQVFGEDLDCYEQIIPRLCRTLRPAPQAGCFVSRLSASKDSAQITLRHRAFRTLAVTPSRTGLKSPSCRWPLNRLLTAHTAHLRALRRCDSAHMGAAHAVDLGTGCEADGRKPYDAQS